MARDFPWSEVAVSAAKGAAVVTAVFGGALGLALGEDPALPGLLLGCAAASYALCFMLGMVLTWRVRRQLARSGPPPTRFVGGPPWALIAALLGFVALTALTLWRG
jgi:hypothetical protein